MSPALQPMSVAFLVSDRTWILSPPTEPPGQDWGVSVNFPFKSRGLMGDGGACRVCWSSKTRIRAGGWPGLGAKPALCDHGWLPL